MNDDYDNSKTDREIRDRIEAELVAVSKKAEELYLNDFPHAIVPWDDLSHSVRGVYKARARKELNAGRS